ncbi:MAG TPA: hypothetical protein PLD54_00195 [Candidatus Levybacteria bacterium]|nr:hypothetical protein [Candidatus Levybacteria bacterium]
MIQLVKKGRYSLIETKRQTKILTLDNKETFAWVSVTNIGEILVASHKSHKTDAILAIGNYRLYTVKDNPDFTDLLHLELLVGEGVWQGYLLPTGLPTDKKKRNRIIPTHEIITKSLF